MNKIFEPATDFAFKPADFVPFKDRELCEKLRKISGTDLEKHESWQHPDFKVKVMMNPHPVLIATLFSRLKEASEKGKKFTMILHILHNPRISPSPPVRTDTDCVGDRWGGVIFVRVDKRAVFGKKGQKRRKNANSPQIVPKIINSFL